MKKKKFGGAIELGDFTLVNESKVDRAVNGSVGKGGKLQGGLLQELGLSSGSDVPADKLLAKYDSLGGLILKGENKVKMGSFYDFVKKCPKETPEVLFETTIDGMIVEVTEEESEALRNAHEKAEELKRKVTEDDEEEPVKKSKKIKK